MGFLSSQGNYGDTRDMQARFKRLQSTVQRPGVLLLYMASPVTRLELSVHVTGLTSLNTDNSLIINTFSVLDSQQNVM